MRSSTRRWLQRELQWRLGLPVVLIMLLGGLLSAWGASYLVETTFDRWLLDAARSLAQQVESKDGRGHLLLNPQAETMLVYDVADRIDFAVLDGDERMAGRADLPQTGSRQRWYAAEGRAFDAIYKGSEVRIAWVDAGAVGPRPIKVGVAETMIKRTQARHDLLLVFSPLSLVLVLAAYVVMRAVQRTVKPLEAMADRWNERSHLSLDTIPTDDVPRELLPFATALNDMLQRVREVLEREQRFASTAAHQLRTPLTALQLGLARALEAPDLATARAVLHELGQTTQRTARLVQQLLALSRLDPELNKSREFAELDLGELAHGVGLTYQDAAADRGVRLEMGEIGPGRALIRGQAELVSEALGNLVDNALRHTPAGGAVRITVACSPPTLTVDDDGPGVPPDERERVFERFARGASAKDTGTGLGLAIVKEIAELHAASVSLTPSSSGGARFSLTFSPLR
ncbi:MAG: sensor histidine kinase [Burkholderiales bacterium]|nr:MAG: sensor histidine kinase [Burkholderiales bacterium]